MSLNGTGFIFLLMNSICLRKFFCLRLYQICNGTLLLPWNRWSCGTSV